MKKIVSLAVVLCLCSVIAQAEVIRIWTSGKFKTEAEFVGLSDDGKTVTLKKYDGVNDAKENGEEITVAIDKLSKEDQEFVAIKQQVPEPLDSPEAIAKRKATLLKKIDLLNKSKSGKAIVELSDEEKDGIVQCLMLAEKAFGKEFSDLDLRGMLHTMSLYKFRGRNETYGGVIWLSSDGSKGSYGSSPTTKIDAYIACWALYDVHWSGSDLFRERDWGVIVPLFPECNKLAGGIHDDKERERKDWQILEDRKKKLIQEIKDMR